MASAGKVVSPDPPGPDGISPSLGPIPSATILGVRVTALKVPDLHRLIAATIDGGEKALMLNVNAHALNLAYELDWLRQFFNQGTVVFPDGTGALFAARIKGFAFEERVTYADWMWSLAEFCSERDYTMYLLGSREGVAEEAAAALQESAPSLRVLGTHHGYFDKSPTSPQNQEVVEEINRLRPDILIVGFGNPLQERWFSQNWDELGVHVGLTAGAVFDYVSGRLPRAPRWLSEHGLEWLGRLIIEPRRLWRRYLIGIPKFCWRVLMETVGLERFGAPSG